MSRQSNRQVGKLGEEIALKFFSSRGYTLLKKNYRVKLGEIDLVLEKDGELVFVEVKARRGTAYGLPQEAVGRAKQRKIAAAAQWFVQERGLQHMNMRFDVLAVLFGPGGRSSVHHIPWAFDISDTNQY